MEAYFCPLHVQDTLCRHAMLCYNVNHFCPHATYFIYQRMKHNYINMLHTLKKPFVNIIITYFDIVELHVNIIILQVHTIYFGYRRQKNMSP